VSSDFLFAQPSILIGAATLFDPAGSLQMYNRSLTPDEADALALISDWELARQDFERAYQAFLDAHPDLAKAA